MPQHSETPANSKTGGYVPMKDPNFERLFADVAKWQAATFPGQKQDGKIAHLHKEILEMMAAPSDISEQADVLILAIGLIALTRTRWSPGAICTAANAREVLVAAHAKLEINKLRKWIDQGDGTWAHDKEQTP
jgi:hypothetical protein